MVQEKWPCFLPLSRQKLFGIAHRLPILPGEKERDREREIPTDFVEPHPDTVITSVQLPVGLTSFHWFYEPLHIRESPWKPGECCFNGKPEAKIHGTHARPWNFRVSPPGGARNLVQRVNRAGEERERENWKNNRNNRPYSPLFIPPPPPPLLYPEDEKEIQQRPP